MYCGKLWIHHNSFWWGNKLARDYSANYWSSGQRKTIEVFRKIKVSFNNKSNEKMHAKFIVFEILDYQSNYNEGIKLPEYIGQIKIVTEDIFSHRNY